MRRSISMTMGILALTLACAPADDAATGDTGAMAAGGDTASGSATTVQLTAQGDGGVNGNVSVTPQGNAVALAIHLMGTAGDYMGHVHRGSCGAAAATADTAAAASLGTFTVPSGGMVDTTAMVQVSRDSLMNGQHYVGFHRGSAGPHVACADLR